MFAVSDAHADILVKKLRDAFRAAYGEIEDAAIRKVTGSVDRVGRLILSFRNDALPRIAVTVDLLSKIDAIATSASGRDRTSAFEPAETPANCGSTRVRSTGVARKSPGPTDAKGR